MPPPQILIDSSFLFVLLDRDSPKFTLAQAIIAANPAEYLIRFVTLAEAAFLFRRAGGVPAVLRFLDTLTASGLPLVPVETSDLVRAREIMATYVDSKLDFVDCCIMAMSERLNVTQVCTFDRRDFSIFRPRHCDYLTILP